MTHGAGIEASVESTRVETDTSLAEERGKTDALLDQAESERAYTDESLLAERIQVDEVVDQTKTLLVEEQRTVGVSKAALARRDEFLAMASGRRRRG